jgi:hypothetical protein
MNHRGIRFGGWLLCNAMSVLLVELDRCRTVGKSV